MSEVSLRDLMEALLGGLETKIDDLTAKVDKLMGYEARISELEHALRMMRWLGGALASVVLALGLGWAKRVLGL